MTKKILIKQILWQKIIKIQILFSNKTIKIISNLCIPNNNNKLIINIHKNIIIGISNLIESLDISVQGQNL